MHYIDVWIEAANMSILFLVNVLVYYKSIQGTFPLHQYISPGYYPLALFAYFHIKLLLPFDSRKPMSPWPVWRVVIEVVLAPFSASNFVHSVVGDYLTSTVKIFLGPLTGSNQR